MPKQEFKGEESIAILKAYPDIHKNIKVLQKILLPLEFDCLLKSFLFPGPYTINMMYMEIIVDFVIDHNLVRPTKIPLYPKYLSSATISKLNARDIVKLRSKLASRGVRVPSFEKVKNTLKQLEEWGLLSSRSDQELNSNKYWLINPRFYLEYGKLFENEFLPKSEPFKFKK